MNKIGVVVWNILHSSKSITNYEVGEAFGLAQMKLPLYATRASPRASIG